MARKVKQTQNDMSRQIPDLPFEIPADQADIKKAGEGGEANTTVAELQAQLKAMREEFAREQKIAHETNLALMQQAPAQTQQFLPTEIEMKGLPDPVSDPEAYASEVAKRTRQAFVNEQKNQQIVAAQAGNDNARVNALWEDFSEAYPEYAKDPSRVSYIAQKLAEKAKARGRDVNKYMFAASATFFSDAVKLYDKEFGRPAGEEVDDDDEGSVLDADELRTSGIPGGGPKSRAVPKDEEGEQGKSIMDGIRSWQQKSGFSI